jgi:ribosomal protein S18 acetylase RimI-like enzyme
MTASHRHIRPARADDARAIAEVHVRAWRAAYADVLPADFLAALSVEERSVQWRQAIATGQTHLLVAESSSPVAPMGHTATAPASAGASHPAAMQAAPASGHGTLLGWISFGPCRDKDSSPADAEIWAFYADPTAWRRGVGRALWQAARPQLLAGGATRCSLWVLAANPRAIAFYESLGFTRDDRAPLRFQLGGAEVDEIRMSLAL